MRIHLNAKLLRVALGNLFQCVNSSTVLPILESVLIEVKDKKIKFTVTDLETTCIYTEDTEVKDEYIFCVDCKSLLHFLRNSLEDEMVIEVGDDTKVKLVCGGFTAKLINDRMEIDQFPRIPSVESNGSFEVCYDTLAPKLTCALRCVSHDYLRPALATVKFEFEEGNFQIAATDAHCLYWEKVMSVTGFESFLLPQKAAMLIVSNFKGQKITVTASDNHVQFTSDTKTLIARKVDCKYPNYKEVIPQYDLSFYLKRKQLISFMKLSSGFVNKATNMVTFFVDNEKINIDGGDIDFDIEFDYSLPVYNMSRKTDSFYFAFNSKMIRKVIDLNKDEYIKIEHTGISAKGFIVDDKFLLMPLMIAR